MISPEVMKELFSVRQVLQYLPASPSTEKGWTPEEQQLFWVALARYPQGPWTTISECIGSKSTRQAMTHAQKLRQKLKRWNKRLRRNPKVSSLMDGVSVTADGNVVVSTGITVNRSPSESHLSLSTSMVSSWYIAAPPASSSPMTLQPPPTPVKQEGLRVGTDFAIENKKTDGKHCAQTETACMASARMLSGEVHWATSAPVQALAPLCFNHHPSATVGFLQQGIVSCGSRPYLSGLGGDCSIGLGEMVADIYVSGHTRQGELGDPSGAVAWSGDIGDPSHIQKPLSPS